MLRQLSGMMLLIGLLSVLGTGCCCVQGMPGGACGTSSCGGGCPPGPLMGLASCRGACGETYVDEWVNEPPVVDDCGYGCGGCSGCGQPLRSVLRQLWGRPYRSQCSTGLCGSSCGDCGHTDCGCDSGGSSGYADVLGDGYAGSGFDDAGYASAASRKSCNCGSSGRATQDYNGPNFSQPSDSREDIRALPPAATPMNGEPQLAPEVAPQIAPSVTPSSATRRLNPALS
ncbi:MAG: hypothetical protein ABI557_13635, partial [Aureliella sp.]